MLPETFSLMPCFGATGREIHMNTNLIRAHGTVMDGWPMLVALAFYLVAFGIFAMTRVPGFLVA
jgi:hypothetical protein